ncbi:DUF3524 domain-containing protein [Malonomonas rubra]|uniref:tRNA-queuosine alpha-mannosyltransferase domain-containing protein n=1 Tax=Malonomonas rubra TaxID=57040 RepID=UPI0026EDA9E5|nr:DUF3524 domain-containing protein [Malonomonas rubra]
MKIALLEPFMVGSHATWAKDFAAHSRHQVEILSLPGNHWKWRMHGGAVTLAHQFLDGGYRPDLLLATDMLDLTSFLALTREVTANIPVALYMHENQLSYPWSPTDVDPALQRDAHYCFINYISALTADAVLFNSDYHRKDFLAELPGFLNTFPDYKEVDSVDKIAEKSRTLHLGLDLHKFDRYRSIVQEQQSRSPLILWNHRWEYDKNPDEFFHALFTLQERGIDFELAVLGKSYRKQPGIFAEARKRLEMQIVHWGYAETFADYAGWLLRADILPVTSVHDFFGISVVEAIYCGCYPLLPKRMAYPEHIPEELRDNHFYDNSDVLVERLSQLCQQVEVREENLSSLVCQYDWCVQAQKYDDLFTVLACR